MNWGPYNAHRAEALGILADLPPALSNPADRIALAQVHATLAVAAASHDEVVTTLAELDAPVGYVPALQPLPDQPLAEWERELLHHSHYVYVASSWRNDLQPVVVDAVRAAGMDVYDFKNPDGGTGFHWSEVGLQRDNDQADVPAYLAALDHPRSRAGFDSDFAAMQRADIFVLVLPCGRSAHLELGWAVGAGKTTVILLEDPCTPELMYAMVDYLAPSLADLVAWLAPELGSESGPTGPGMG